MSSIPQTKKNFNVNFVCKSCTQEDYRSEDFPNPRVFFCCICGKKDVKTIGCCNDRHTANELNPTSSHFPNLSNPLSFDKETGLCGTVFLGNHLAIAKFDTGLSRSFIGELYANELGIEKNITRNEIPVRMQDGSLRIFKEQLLSRIKFGNWYGYISLIISDIIKEKVILGLDFLQNVSAKISLCGSEITLKQSDCPGTFVNERIFSQSSLDENIGTSSNIDCWDSKQSVSQDHSYTLKTFSKLLTSKNSTHEQSDNLQNHEDFSDLDCSIVSTNTSKSDNIESFEVNLESSSEVHYIDLSDSEDPGSTREKQSVKVRGMDTTRGESIRSNSGKRASSESNDLTHYQEKSRRKIRRLLSSDTGLQSSFSDLEEQAVSSPNIQDDGVEVNTSSIVLSDSDYDSDVVILDSDNEEASLNLSSDVAVRKVLNNLTSNNSESLHSGDKFDPAMPLVPSGRLPLELRQLIESTRNNWSDLNIEKNFMRVYNGMAYFVKLVKNGSAKVYCKRWDKSKKRQEKRLKEFIHTEMNGSLQHVKPLHIDSELSGNSRGNDKLLPNNLAVTIENLPALHSNTSTNLIFDDDQQQRELQKIINQIKKDFSTNSKQRKFVHVVNGLIYCFNLFSSGKVVVSCRGPKETPISSPNMIADDNCLPNKIQKDNFESPENDDSLGSMQHSDNEDLQQRTPRIKVLTPDEIFSKFKEPLPPNKFEKFVLPKKEYPPELSAHLEELSKNIPAGRKINCIRYFNDVPYRIMLDRLGKVTVNTIKVKPTANNDNAADEFKRTENPPELYKRINDLVDRWRKGQEARCQLPLNGYVYHVKIKRDGSTVVNKSKVLPNARRTLHYRSDAEHIPELKTSQLVSPDRYPPKLTESIEELRKKWKKGRKINCLRYLNGSLYRVKISRQGIIKVSCRKALPCEFEKLKETGSSMCILSTQNMSNKNENGEENSKSELVAVELPSKSTPSSEGFQPTEVPKTTAVAYEETQNNVKSTIDDFSSIIDSTSRSSQWLCQQSIPSYNELNPIDEYKAEVISQDNYPLRINEAIEDLKEKWIIGQQLSISHVIDDHIYRISFKRGGAICVTKCKCRPKNTQLIDSLKSLKSSSSVISEKNLEESSVELNGSEVLFSKFEFIPRNKYPLELEKHIENLKTGWKKGMLLFHERVLNDYLYHIKFNREGSTEVKRCKVSSKISKNSPDIVTDLELSTSQYSSRKCSEGSQLGADILQGEVNCRKGANSSEVKNTIKSSATPKSCLNESILSPTTEESEVLIHHSKWRSKKRVQMFRRIHNGDITRHRHES